MLLVIILLSPKYSWLMLAGVDFKLKYLEVDNRKLKLTVWDTGAVPPP